MSDVLNIFNLALTAVASWFVQLLNASGMASLYISMFFIFLVGKFLLTPLFGSSGSDKVYEDAFGQGG